MEQVKWIKLIVTARNGKSMKQLKALPNGERMALLWYELMQLAGEVNEQGFLYYDDDFPYTEEMLATELNYDFIFIKYALEMMTKLKMITIIDDVFCLANWNKYQNVKGLNDIRERNRLYMQEYRARKGNKNNLLEEPKKAENKPETKAKEEFKKYGEYGWVKLKQSQYDKIKKDYPNIDLDNQIKLLDEYIQSNGNKNKYKDFNLVLRKSIRDKWFINENKEKEAKCHVTVNDNKIDFNKILDYWNEKGTKAITAITSERQSHIETIIQEYGEEAIYKAIDKVKTSSFLNGENDKKWIATFDWIILPNNFIKVLEGNYDNPKDLTLPDWYEDYLIDVEDKIKENGSKYDGVSLEELLKDFKEK